MKFVFLDEVEQPQKKPGFFAVSTLVVDSRFYRALKEGLENAFEQANWSPDIEFKGRYIFSSSKGDKSVSVEARIEVVRAIVAKTTAKKNARARFCFAHNGDGKTPENYLHLVGKAAARCPRPDSRKGDKALVAVYFDQTELVSASQVEKVVRPVLAKRDLFLVETAVPLGSSNATAGLIAADVLAYLKSWDVLYPDPKEADRASLFETSVDKLHADKLRTIREILDLIKSVEVV
jgi:hypothetical protein